MVVSDAPIGNSIYSYPYPIISPFYPVSTTVFTLTLDLLFDKKRSSQNNRITDPTKKNAALEKLKHVLYDHRPSPN